MDFLARILFVGIICSLWRESLQNENITTTAIHYQIGNFTALQTAHGSEIISFISETTVSRSIQEQQDSSTDSSLAETEYRYGKDGNDAWSAESSSRTYSGSLLILHSFTEIEYQDDDNSQILITMATGETDQAVFEHPTQTGYVIFSSMETDYNKPSSIVTSLPMVLAPLATNIPNTNHSETNFQKNDAQLNDSMMSQVYDIHRLGTTSAPVAHNTIDINIYDEPHVAIIFDENFQQMMTNTSDEDYQDFGGIYHDNHSTNYNKANIFNISISKQFTNGTNNTETNLVLNSASSQTHGKSSVNITNPNEHNVTLESSTERGDASVYSNDEITSITTSIADQEELSNVSLDLTVTGTKNYMPEDTTIISDRETIQEIIASSYLSMKYHGNESISRETDIQTHSDVSSEDDINRETDLLTDTISSIFTAEFPLNHHKQSTSVATRNETEQLTYFTAVSSESMISSSVTVTTIFTDDEEQNLSDTTTDVQHHGVMTPTSVISNTISGESYATDDTSIDTQSGNFFGEQVFKLDAQTTSKDISPVFSTNIFTGKLPERENVLTNADNLISVTYPKEDIVLTPSYIDTSDRNSNHVTTKNMAAVTYGVSEITEDNTYMLTEEQSNDSEESNSVSENVSEQTYLRNQYTASISYTSSKESPTSLFMIESSFGQSFTTKASASEINSMFFIQSESASETSIHSSMPEMPTQISAYLARGSENILSQGTKNMPAVTYAVLEITQDNTYTLTEELNNDFEKSNSVYGNISEQISDQSTAGISYASSRESLTSLFVIESSFGQSFTTEVSATEINSMFFIQSASTSETSIHSNMSEMPPHISAHLAPESRNILSQGTEVITKYRTVSGSYYQVTYSGDIELLSSDDLNASSYQSTLTTSSKDFASSESRVRSSVDTRITSVDQSTSALILTRVSLPEKIEIPLSSSIQESSFFTQSIQHLLTTMHQELTDEELLSSSWRTPSPHTTPRETDQTVDIFSSAPSDHLQVTIPIPRLSESDKTATSHLKELLVTTEEISASAVLPHDNMINISYTDEMISSQSHLTDSEHFSQVQSTSLQFQQGNYASVMSDAITDDFLKSMKATQRVDSVLVSLATVEEKIDILSSETPRPSETAPSVINPTSDDTKMDTTTSADQRVIELQTTQIPATHPFVCKYDQEFLTAQSEVPILQKEFDSLTKNQMNNTITAVFNFTKDREWIDLYTKNFNKWMIKMLLAEIKQHNMKSPSSPGKSSSDTPRIDLIYILPSPNVFGENLIFTFFGLISPQNDTIPIDSIIEALLSDLVGMQNCINLTLSYYIRGRHRLPNEIDSWESLNQVWQKYGILLLTVSMLTLLIVVILVAAVIYLRCKSRRSVAYISDMDRLHNDLHASTEIRDLNRGSIILQEEVCEKDASLVNGNHVHTIGDDEGWLVPINDVPLEDKDAPDIQDTKL